MSRKPSKGHSGKDNRCRRCLWENSSLLLSKLKKKLQKLQGIFFPNCKKKPQGIFFQTTNTKTARDVFCFKLQGNISKQREFLFPYRIKNFKLQGNFFHHDLCTHLHQLPLAVLWQLPGSSPQCSWREIQLITQSWAKHLDGKGVG